MPPELLRSDCMPGRTVCCEGGYISVACPSYGTVMRCSREGEVSGMAKQGHQCCLHEMRVREMVCFASGLPSCSSGARCRFCTPSCCMVDACLFLAAGLLRPAWKRRCSRQCWRT